MRSCYVAGITALRITACHSPQMSRRYAVFGRFLIYPLQHTTEVTKHVENIPRGRFRVEAWDVYSDGIFQYTRYLICTV